MRVLSRILGKAHVSHPCRSVVSSAVDGESGSDLDSAYRDKGLGSVLLDAVLRTARVELDVFTILVDAKYEATQRFYEHYGFALLRGAERRLRLPIATALWQFRGPDSS